MVAHLQAYPEAARRSGADRKAALATEYAGRSRAIDEDSFADRVVPLRNPARRAVVRSGLAPESVRPGALPVLVVAAAVLGFEIAYGAAPGDAVLYLAYEAGFVVIPGWLYRALTRQAGDRYGSSPWAGPRLRARDPRVHAHRLGRRAWPVPGVPAGGRAASAGRDALPSTTSRPPGLRPAAATVVCVAVGGRLYCCVTYISLAYFPTAPLPGQESVNYFPDYPRWIAIAADAKHHWPIEDPSVAGEPLPYHYFVYVHMAAASQVTGLDLPLVFLRLFILPLAVLLVLELVVAQKLRSAYAG